VHQALSVVQVDSIVIQYISSKVLRKLWNLFWSGVRDYLSKFGFMIYQKKDKKNGFMII